jgi:hypothetical protein
MTRATRDFRPDLTLHDELLILCARIDFTP